MKIKSHIVGGQELCAPADIEGHLGTDGLYYVLDTARVFPPVSDDEDVVVDVVLVVVVVVVASLKILLGCAPTLFSSSRHSADWRCGCSRCSHFWVRLHCC
jgi:hypothetical protein